VAVNQTQGAIASGVAAVRVVLNQTYFVYRELVVTATPTASSAPSLQISLLNNGFVRVWWPTSAAGYALKTTPTLGVAVADWQTVTNTVLTTNGSYQVLLPIGNTQFLRLQK
jgi:hypothetical protein